MTLLDLSRDMSHDGYSRKLSNSWPILLLRLFPWFSFSSELSIPSIARDMGGRVKFPLRFSHADRTGLGGLTVSPEVSPVDAPDSSLPDIQKVLSMVWGKRKMSVINITV